MKTFLSKDFSIAKINELRASGHIRAWTGGKSPTVKNWRANLALRKVTRWFFHAQLYDASLEGRLALCETLPSGQTRHRWRALASFGDVRNWMRSQPLT
jgi:hypothetical protein